jgi:hypothetical protein
VEPARLTELVRPAPVLPLPVDGQRDLFSPAPNTAVEEKDSPAACVPGDWLTQLLSSPVYQAQKDLVRKHLPEDAAVVRCLEVLDHHGGTLTLAALAQQAGILPLRLDGFLAKLQRLLNVDGYEVLLVDRTQNRVSVNVAILRRQFELG